jgi:uncharacterized protein (TIGR02266 family)
MAKQTTGAAQIETANTPLGQAVQMLNETLDNIRRIGKSDTLEVDQIVQGVQEAITLLKNIDASNLRDATVSAGITSAMNHLRTALGALQLITRNAESIEEISRTIAKILAILYPLSKFGGSKIPVHPAEKAPVPEHIKERRQAPRIAIEAEVGFQSETNFFMGFSEDISTGGLFISTYDIRPIGSVINLNFTLPDGHLISVDGVVRWVREYNETTPDTSPGMGIQFDGLGPEDKEAIHLFIEERPAIFYDDE